MRSEQEEIQDQLVCCSSHNCHYNRGYADADFADLPKFDLETVCRCLTWFALHGCTLMCAKASQEAAANYIQVVPRSDWATLLLTLDFKISRYWADKLRLSHDPNHLASQLS